MVAVTEHSESVQSDELPRRLAGERELPAPDKPLHVETDETMLTRVRDGLQRYQSPEAAECCVQGVCWWQPRQHETEEPLGADVDFGDPLGFLPAPREQVRHRQQQGGGTEARLTRQRLQVSSFVV